MHKIARDTFGYFYLFNRTSIQRYNGREFENLHLTSPYKKWLTEPYYLKRSKAGGISIVFIDRRTQLFIPPASLSISEIDEQHSEWVPQLSDWQNHAYNYKGKQILVDEGTFWNTTEDPDQNLSERYHKGMICNASAMDKKGNIIAAFGYQRNISNEIIVFKADGTTEDYSQLLQINDKIRDIYVDDIDHKLMLATYNGLYVLSFSRPGISNFFTRSEVRGSSFGNLVMDVSSKGPKVVFIDEGYGVYQLDSTGREQLLHAEKENDFYDNRRLIWNEFNQKYYSTSTYTAESSMLYSWSAGSSELDKNILGLHVRTMWPLDKNLMLIAGSDATAIDESKAGKIIYWDTQERKKTGTIDNIPMVRCVADSPEGYWVGTQSGVYLLLKDKSLSKLNIKGIESAFITTIYMFNSKVYVATLGDGVFVVNPNTKEVEHRFNKNNFLSDDEVASLIEDNHGNLWVGTFKGIDVINKEHRIILKLSASDGIAHREMNTEAASKDKAGKLYFGSLNGLIQIDPEQVLEWTTSHGLHMDQLRVYGNGDEKLLALKDATAKINTNVDSVFLDVDFPDYNSSILKAPVNYLELPKDLNARKTLGGIMISKKELVSQRLHFSNLRNDYNSTLQLSVKRDIQEYMWLGLLLFIFSSLIYMYLNKRRLRKFTQAEKQKTVLNKKMAELELSALQSQMNPHFIFNALGAIQYFIQTEKTEEADRFLGSFAMLMRKILDSSKSKYISLVEEIELLKLYISLEQMRFEGQFHFKLDIEEEVDLETLIPPMIIQPFVENAINHGLYNLKDRTGMLELIFHSNESDKLTCIIRDNGIGRDKAGELRNKKHKSRGLQIVNDRVATLNAQGDMYIELITNDLFSKDKSIGTEVVIAINHID